VQSTGNYRAILAMIPASFPDQNKFDVANSVVEDLLGFKIARSQVQHRVGDTISQGLWD
jgi:hypothetical protein